jgi:hypothetical protein
MKSRRQANAVVCLLLLMVAMVSSRFAEAADEAMPLHQQIDELIGKRLVELKVVPAMVSGDAEFVRRIYLDLTGVTEAGARFLDDSSPIAAAVDGRLSSPDYAIHMARVFDVMIERRIPTITRMTSRSK